MTSRLIVLVLLLAGTACSFAPGAAPAPPVQATAHVARSTVQVGEPVRITIQVQNSDEIPQIDAPRVEGLAITSTGTAEVKPSILRNVRPLSTGHLPGSKIVESLRDLQQQLANASGGMPTNDPQRTQSYQAQLRQGLGNLQRSDYAIVYLATPEQTGPLTIPPFTVHAGGQTVQTRPLEVSVLEPRSSPWVQAALSLSKSRPMVGDTVHLHVDLLVRRWTQQIGRGQPDLKSQPINHVTLTIPLLEGYREIQPLEPLEKYVEKRRLSPGQLGYHINSYPGVILLEQEPASSRSEKLDPQWYRRRLTIPFRAVQASEIELPPLRVAGEVYVPSGGKNRYSWEGFVASSAPLKFQIVALAHPSADAHPAASPPPQPAPTQATAEASANTEPTPSPAKYHFPRTAALVTLLAVFVAVLAAALRPRYAVWRQRGARKRQQRQAIAQARQHLHAPPVTAAAVSAAVQNFLRARLQLAPGEITPEEAAASLTQAGYPITLAESCAEVLRACAARQFAPGHADNSAADLALGAERLLDAILATRPRAGAVASAAVDELTRQRQAALADS